MFNFTVKMYLVEILPSNLRKTSSILTLLNSEMIV